MKAAVDITTNLLITTINPQVHEFLMDIKTLLTEINYACERHNSIADDLEALDDAVTVLIANGKYLQARGVLIDLYMRSDAINKIKDVAPEHTVDDWLNMELAQLVKVKQDVIASAFV